MTDERVRTIERAAREGDPLALMLAISERARREDPLERLRAIIARAQALFRDAHFTLKDVLVTLRSARHANEEDERGHPLPGYLWVANSGPHPRMPRVRDGSVAAAGGAYAGPKRPEPTLHRYAEEHEPAFKGDGSPCAVCGAVGMVGSRCVLEVKDPEEGREWRVPGLAWWRGVRSDGGRRNAAALARFVPRPPDGVRHMALCYWDAEAGIAAVEVRTGTSRQTVATVFGVMKKKRSEAYRPRDRMKLIRWAFEEDPQRVTMTASHASVILETVGPRRNVSR